MLTMSREIIIVDEGIILTGAMRVANGDLVHRDFYSSYGPAQYYIVAAVLGLFKQSFMAERIYDALIKALICSAVFHFTSRLCRQWVAVLFTVICGLWFVAVRGFLYPIFPCMLLAMLATYLLIPPATGEGISRAGSIAAGLCAGLAALFRYEVGFFLLVANLVGVAVLMALSEPLSFAFRRFLRVALSYAAGSLLVFVPAAVSFLAVSPVAGFWHDIVEYAVKYYGPMRGLPFPMPWDPRAAAIYLPPIAATLAAIEVVRMSWPHRPLGSTEAEARAYLVLFGCTAALLFLKGVVRVQALHALLAIVPALIVIAILVDRWLQSTRSLRLVAIGLALLVITPSTASALRDLSYSASVPDRSLIGWIALQSGLLRTSATERATCHLAPYSGIARLEADYVRVANYLDTYSRPDERILVALDRHDRIFASPVALYFAAGRLPGTHWQQFDPGLQTRGDIQARIISELQHNNVRWVVRDSSFKNMNEPNGSAQSSGVTLLDDYLDHNYRPVAVAGKIQVWLEKGETPIAYRPAAPCTAATLPDGISR
jgi:hypothetical protein